MKNEDYQIHHEVPNGSELCLYCGLCCQGALHISASLDVDELELANHLTLSVSQNENREHAFHLPCHLYLDSKCSVYNNRPRVCRVYQCKLLKNYKSGNLSYEDAKSLVDKTRELFITIQAQLLDKDTLQNIWLKFKEWGDTNGIQTTKGRRDNAEFLTKLAALRVFLQRYFFEDSQA